MSLDVSGTFWRLRAPGWETHCTRAPAVRLPRRSDQSQVHMSDMPIDVAAVRKHFLFPRSRQVVTNNAASTQPPRELIDLYRALSPDYENVHRGQSDASRLTTLLFENSYETIARFINAPTMRSIVAYRNTTEAN